MYLCTQCKLSLPLTNFHLLDENPIKKMFWGRIPLHYATSYYYFSKESRVQKLIHNIKYYGLQHLAVEIGRYMGRAILQNPQIIEHIDLIAPVPLHPRKLKSRGFNQSECLAKGISEVTQKPISVENLVRLVHSPTQTRKSRYKRWENVSGIFNVKNKEEFKNRHILLVDDVITTGSTIEACFEAMKETENLKLSIASIAFAHA